MKRLWLLSLLCSLTLLSATTRAQNVVIPYPGPGIITITGTWRFHTGDDLRWLSPTFDASNWESLSADNPWGSQTHPGYTGYAWYRRSIQVDNVTGPLSLYLPPVDSTYELYWNGQRIGGFGQLPPHASWYLFPVSNVFSLPKPSASGQLIGVLAIRIWKPMLISFDPSDGGGLTGPPQIGDSNAIKIALRSNEDSSIKAALLGIVEQAILLLAGLIAGGIWIFDRSRKLPLWMGVFFLGMVGYIVFEFPACNRLITIYWMESYLGIVNAARDLGIWMLVLVLFGLDRQRGWRKATQLFIILYLAALAIDIAALWLWDSGWPVLRAIDWVMTCIFSLLPTYLFVLLIAGLRRRRDLSLLPMALACSVIEAYWLMAIGLSQFVQFTGVRLMTIITKMDIHLGPYQLSLGTSLQFIVLGVVVWTVYREQEQERHRQRFIESEMKSAHEIQSVLIPEEPPAIPGFTISTLYWPAGEVGGDMFQVIPDNDGGVLIVLADVSGKGLKAAMTVSLLVGAVRTIADVTTNPLSVLTTLNHRLLGHSSGGFCTCLALHVSATGLVTLANAGHLPPFFSGRAIPLEGSLPLGIISAPDFSIINLQLEENDDLTLYTDGVLEAQSSTGELYGFDRTAQLFGTRASVRTIAAAARSFGQTDDITVIKVIRASSQPFSTHIFVDLQTAT